MMIRTMHLVFLSPDEMTGVFHSQSAWIAALYLSLLLSYGEAQTAIRTYAKALN